jgi:Brp/Blh family beta-carotene 15,15'-monooxygenase
MQFSNNYFHRYQIIFVSCCLILSAVLSFEENTNFTLSNVNLDWHYFIFVLIGAIGLGHGAMDGKLIWFSTKQNNIRMKRYSTYLFLAIFALLVWVLNPLLGILLLILMSIYHFGESDLFEISNSKLQKILWGYSMSLMPFIFKSSETIEILNHLSGSVIEYFVGDLIRFSLYPVILVLFLNLLKNSQIYLFLQLLSLLILSYLLDPIPWFAIYFCFQHGIKALFNMKFTLTTDVFWMLGFTIPILLVWFPLASNKEISYEMIIFPTLFAVTVSHMMVNMINRKIN